MPEKQLNPTDQGIPEVIQQAVEEAEAFSVEDWRREMEGWDEIIFTLVESMVDRQGDYQYARRLLEIGVNPKNKLSRIALTIIFLSSQARVKLKQALTEWKTGNLVGKS